MTTPARPLIGFDCAQPITQGLLPRLAASGAGFAIRYFTPDLAEAKDLTAAEVSRVVSAIPGFVFVSVFETTAARALGGTSAGVSDAWSALQCASRVGQPVGSAIYFAVDFDLVGEQLGQAKAYFQAIRDVFGRQAKPFRLGVYGNGLVCQTLLDAKIVELTWLAGGLGMTGSRAFLLSQKWNLLQHVGDEARLGLGISIDSDEAAAAEPASYGGWTTEMQTQVQTPAPIIGPVIAIPPAPRAVP